VRKGGWGRAGRKTARHPHPCIEIALNILNFLIFIEAITLKTERKKVERHTVA
jgi:hypothetical protein